MRACCVCVCRRVVRVRASCTSTRCVRSRFTLYFSLIYYFRLHYFFLLCAMLFVWRALLYASVCVYIYAGVLCVRAQAAPVLVVWVRVARCAFFCYYLIFIYIFFLLCAILCALLALARKLRECSLCTFALRVVISFLIICFYFLLLLCNFFCVRFCV